MTPAVLANVLILRAALLPVGACTRLPVFESAGLTIA